MIGESISFENCYNGIYVGGKVTGSDSGIKINGNIGDENSVYGI